MWLACQGKYCVLNKQMKRINNDNLLRRLKLILFCRAQPAVFTLNICIPTLESTTEKRSTYDKLWRPLKRDETKYEKFIAIQTLLILKSHGYYHCNQKRQSWISQNLVWFDSFYVRDSTITATSTVGHRFNPHRRKDTGSQRLVMPGGHPGGHPSTNRGWRALISVNGPLS